MLREALLSREFGRMVAELEARIDDRCLVPFDRDHYFVLDLLSRLKAKGDFDAVVALDQLVPRWNQDGTRQIGDRRISQKLEETIASRYLAPEVSLLGRDGVWGSVPLDVRKEIQKSGDIGIVLEMTDRCTVMCDFCGFADKGKITKKVDFASVIEIINGFYADGNRGDIYTRWIPSDAFYWGSDPFDIRWFNESTGIDFDYGDILERHAEICGKRRTVYTSTAMPIGEELRILSAFLWYLQARKDGRIRNESTFRFSKTDVNEYRLKQILTIAESLYGNSLEHYGVSITENRNEKPFLAGTRVFDPKKITYSDIIGVNCMDAIVITLEGLVCVMMEGTSTEMMRGEARWAARSVTETDGEVRYEIPRYYYKPDILNGDPKLFYPDVEIKTVTVRPGEKTLVRCRTITGDPHRSLLRLATVAYHYFHKDGGRHKWEPGSLSASQKKEVFGIVGRDLEVVREHLREKVWGKGKENRMMEAVYHSLVSALKD